MTLDEYTEFIEEFGENGKLEIDEFALELECKEQPKLYRRVSKTLAYALSERDAIENKLKVWEAKTAQHFRQAAKVSGEKVTEAIIDEQVLGNPLRTDFTDNIFKIRIVCNELLGLLQSWAQRKDMLTNLVKLALGDYYSDVKTNTSDKQYQDNRKRMRQND